MLGWDLLNPRVGPRAISKGTKVMAAVNITINGVICDLYGRTISGPLKIVGEAMYTDLGVGGGPIFPPVQPPGGGGSPPGIWGGGNEPFPTPPIANVPGVPGYRPPVPPGTGIWPNPPEGIAPIPGHPIVLPGDPSWGPPSTPGTPGPGGQFAWKLHAGWDPIRGWHTVVVGEPIGDAPVATPSDDAAASESPAE